MAQVAIAVALWLQANFPRSPLVRPECVIGAAVRHSRESAIAYVVTAVEAKGTATRDDFNVPAIVAASRAIAESWDFGAMEKSLFWNIAASNLRF